MKKAFTITELLLAISLMVVLMASSGVVFKTAVTAHRTASATAEIARKLRGITDQLNADFKGLRKDGIIFAVWVPVPVDIDGNALDPTVPGFNPATIVGYKRADRIFFFANGDFQTYNEWPYLTSSNQVIRQVIRGNLARICYMLADDANGRQAQAQAPQKRILARSQHLLVTDPAIVQALNADGTTRASVRDFPDLANIPIPLQLPPNADYIDMNNDREYDWATLGDWNNATLDQLAEMFTVVTGVKVLRTWAGEDPDPTEGGLELDVDSKPPLNIHQLLCQGVGDFSIQGWYEDSLDPTAPPRWYPELYLNPTRTIARQADTDFRVDPSDSTMLDTINVWYGFYHPSMGDMNSIPGLGRALKFTFTLYDFRGIFKDGKKFTHIVYLDD